MADEGIESKIDILRFRSVCKSWRSSLLLPRIVSVGFPPRISITTSSGNHLLMSNTICLLEPSDLSKTLSNSSFSRAWLIKVVESNYGRLRLLNPFTNGRLTYSHSNTRYPSYSLTKVLNLLNFRFIEVIKAHSISLNGYDGSRPPPQDGKVVVFPNFGWTKVENRMFFSVHRDGKLGFSKIGDDEWTPLDDKNFHYDDILVHKGQLYVVDRWGTVSWIDCSSLTLVQFSPPLCGLGKKYKKHLVESCGSLCLVDMYFEGNPNQVKGACYDVVDLRVYKLDEEWGR